MDSNKSCSFLYWGGSDELLSTFKVTMVQVFLNLRPSVQQPFEITIMLNRITTTAQVITIAVPPWSHNQNVGALQHTYSYYHRGAATRSQPPV